MGQPLLRRPSEWKSKVVWKLALANRIFPTLGKYRFFGQDDIDRRVVELLLAKDEKSSSRFFVDVGSNDGHTFSNSKHLELFHKFSGICIEPYLPNVELARLHRDCQQVHAAIVPSDFDGDEVELEFSNLMTSMILGPGSESEAQRIADDGAAFLPAGQFRHRFVAPARTLQEILETLGAPRHIDLLSIDIEGYELECLESFDFETWSFEVIVVESYNHDETQRFFSRRGYRLSDDFSHNLIFVRDAD